MRVISAGTLSICPINERDTLYRQLEVKGSQIIVRIIEKQGIELEQGGRLQEEHFSNSPDVSNVAVILVIAWVHEGIFHPDKSGRKQTGWVKDSVELK